MENIQFTSKFSSKIALDSINRIRGNKIDQRSKDLFYKYECMHDAYLREFNIMFPDEWKGCIECSLTLNQDYIDPPSTIIIKIHEVQELKLMITPKDWYMGTEIVYMYFNDCEDGIQVTCETDDRVNFSLIAKYIEIEEGQEKNKSDSQLPERRFKLLDVRKFLRKFKRKSN